MTTRGNKRWSGAGPQKQGPKAPASPAEPVRRDANEQPIPPPLKKPEISIDTRGQPGKSSDDTHHNNDHSIKIDEKLTKQVEQTLEQSKDKGYKEQFKEVRRTVEKAAEVVDPGTIKEIRVDVSGNVDGMKKRDKYTVDVKEVQKKAAEEKAAPKKA